MILSTLSSTKIAFSKEEESLLWTTKTSSGKNYFCCFSQTNLSYERTTIIPNESSDEEDPDSTKTQIAGPSKTRDNFRADLKREHSISSFGPPRKRVLPPVHARQLKPRPPKPSAQSKVTNLWSDEAKQLNRAKTSFLNIFNK